MTEKGKRDYIDPLADKIVRTTGLKKAEVKKALLRCDEEDWLYNRTGTKTPLEEAFDFLEPSVALEVFIDESEDLEVLRGKVSFFEHLAYKFSPFYTLGELRDLTGAFIVHLQSNRDHLLRTGFPQKAFDRSPWLDLNLGKLYYVKLPLIDPYLKYDQLQEQQKHGRMESTISYTDSEGDTAHKYIWVREQAIYIDASPFATPVSNPCFHWIDGKACTKDEIVVTPGEYDDAVLIPGLSQSKADRLEEMRDRFFNLKISVLKLLRNLKEYSVDPKRFIEECLVVIKDELPIAEDVEFLLDCDKLYQNLFMYNDVNYSENQQFLANHAAGLSDLLYIIGFYFREIDSLKEPDSNIISMHKACERIKGIQNNKFPLMSYYQSLGMPWRSRLDDTLFEFLIFKIEGQRFWKQFGEQFNCYIEDDFDVDVINRNRIRRKLKPEFESGARILSDFYKNFLEVRFDSPNLNLADFAGVYSSGIKDDDIRLFFENAKFGIEQRESLSHKRDLSIKARKVESQRKKELSQKLAREHIMNYGPCSMHELAREVRDELKARGEKVGFERVRQYLRESRRG